MNPVHCKVDRYDVYIGRENKNLPKSKWHNPFIMKNEKDRSYVVDKYELWLNTQPDLLECIHSELNGKILGCWCSPKSCHGDVLVEYSKSYYIKNWFSNMLPFDKPLDYGGIIFNTVENFYQAMKLPKDRTDLRAEIAKMNPYEAKKSIKNKEKYQWRDSWNQDESLKVMEYILRFKFSPYSIWLEKLLMTEDWEITEWNNWNDTFWGKDIKTRKGENNLGKLLMKIRNERRKKD